MVKQTAGRDALHDFAPKFAELNDDVYTSANGEQAVSRICLVFFFRCLH